MRVKNQTRTMFIEKHKHIETQLWCERDIVYKVAIVYGMCYWLNAPCPHFTIKGGALARKKNDTEWYPQIKGHPHDLIATHAPMLSELLKFDFWGQNGLRVNYLEWVTYLYENYRGWFNPDFGRSPKISNQERQSYRHRFRDIVLLSPGDKIPFIKNKNSIGELETWLETRKPILQSQFHTTMKKFEIEYITEGEMQAFNQKYSQLN